MIDYTVILLNYFTNDDLLKAIKSIEKSAQYYSFRVIVVNVNLSGKNSLEISNENVDIININENRGFAYGNNIGLRYVIEHTNSKYIVIMNPDTLLVEEGTIDRLIDEIEIERDKDSKIIGGQPLIQTAGTQNLSIREVYTYFDSLIQVFLPLRLVFKKRYNNMWKKNSLNDKKQYFEVPAGNFFIIDANIFFYQLHGFDEHTFLYEEEMILGFKLKSIGLHFLFVPSEKVNHEQGKSTHSHQKLSYFAFKHMLHSKNIYLKKYLKVGLFHVVLLDLLFITNFICMKLVNIKKINRDG